MTSRFGRFSLVGLLGAVVQMALLYGVRTGCGLSSAAATPIAVEIAVLHNFLWHEHFTWNDRGAGTWRGIAARLWRFHAANGFISIAGNTVVMYWLVDRLHAPLLPSAAGAIAMCAVANFLAADRWVFADAAGIRPGARPLR
jgi:putative flippase GtrA